jgi:hypothetical protein
MRKVLVGILMKQMLWSTDIHVILSISLLQTDGWTNINLRLDANTNQIRKNSAVRISGLGLQGP